MPIIHVTDVNDVRLAAYCRLTDGQLRDGIGGGRGGGLFVGESRKVIDRALDAGVRMGSLFMEEKWLEQTMPVARWRPTLRRPCSWRRASSSML